MARARNWRRSHRQRAKRPKAPIAGQKHGFFERDGFRAVLRAVQVQPKRFKVYEKNGTLRISVAAVKNIGEAKRALEGVVGASLILPHRLRCFQDHTTYAIIHNPLM